MLRVPPDIYRTIQQAAASRGLEMGPMLLDLLAPILQLLKTHTDDN